MMREPTAGRYNRPLYGDVFGVLLKTNDMVCPAETLLMLYTDESHRWESQ